MGTVGTYSNSGTDASDAVCEAALGCECVGAQAPPMRVENGQGRREELLVFLLQLLSQQGHGEGQKWGGEARN